MLSSEAIDILLNAAIGGTTRPALMFLYLAQCNVLDSTLKAVAARCKDRLKALDLYDCKRISLAGDVANVLQLCQGLRYINICGCDRTYLPWTDTVQEWLLGLPNLRTLYLDLGRLGSNEQGISFAEEFLRSHPEAKIAKVQCPNSRAAKYSPSAHQFGRSVTNERIYIGEMNDKDEMHGNGKIEWTNGTTYQGKDCCYCVLADLGIGEWREGRMHGVGECHWIEGKTYQGEWANGAMHGNGVFTALNGEKFYGSFLRGKRHGTGALYSPEGKLVSEENWKNGKRVRKGDSITTHRQYHPRYSRPTMF